MTYIQCSNKSIIVLMNIYRNTRHHILPDIAKEETCHNCSSTKGNAHEINPFKSLHVGFLICTFSSKKNCGGDSRNLSKCGCVLTHKSSNKLGDFGERKTGLYYGGTDDGGNDRNQSVLEDIEVNGISVASVWHHRWRNPMLPPRNRQDILIAVTVAITSSGDMLFISQHETIQRLTWSK